MKIVASGGVDEYLLAQLTQDQAPIDLYGIGTSLVTSDDLPALDCAYKLKAYAGVARRKRSEGKTYWPGPTQVYRRYDARGRLCSDILTTADARASDSETADAAGPLLRPVARNGRILEPLPDLAAIRRLAATELGHLPASLRRLQDAPTFTPRISGRLRALADQVDRETRV